jgi:replicative DNA helicase
VTAAPDRLHSIEAEHAVLGCLLFDNDGLDLLPELGPEHFYEPLHARLFGQIRTLVRGGRLAEPVGVYERLSADTALAEVGGLEFLVDLVAKAPPTTVVTEHAATVVDYATRRALTGFAQQVGSALRQTDRDAAAIVADVEVDLARIGEFGGVRSSFVSAGQAAAEAIDQARRGVGGGLSIGISVVDAVVGGVRRGQLAVLGARPGVGKTTVGGHVVRAVARQGLAALFFSLETPATDLALRLACSLACEAAAEPARRAAGPCYSDAASGRLSHGEWLALEAARDAIALLPLEIDDRAGLSVREMRSLSLRRFRRFEREGIGRGIVVVDHLTIARPDQDRGGNKVAEVGDISRALVEMAKALNVPVLALAQLSREVDKRGDDHRPTLADLRWSGEIEQDARVVILLNRPEYYLGREPSDEAEAAAWVRRRAATRNKLYFLIAKNSNGPTAEVETYCDMARAFIGGQTDGDDP